MRSYLRWPIILSLFTIVLSIQSQIDVNLPHQLEELLCHEHSFTEPTELILSTAITHEISGAGFCIVNIIQSLTIVSKDSGVSAMVQCASMENGFIFTGNNVSSLFLSRVSFLSCGTNLSCLNDSLRNEINASISPVFFTQHHAAALLVNGIDNVEMKNVDLVSYYGFAIILINLHNGTLGSVKLKSPNPAISKGISIGSGLLVLYHNKTSHDSNCGSNKGYNLDISFLTLLHLFDDIFEYECIQNLYNSSITSLERVPIVNAAGLTIFYVQNDIPAIVNIFNSHFSHCYGSLAGGLLIVHQNSYTLSQTHFNGCTFDTNSNIHGCHGGAIVAVVFYDQKRSILMTSLFNQSFVPLVVSDSVFHDNGRDGTAYSGAINLMVINPGKLQIQFYFKRVKLMFNYASTDGSCLVGLVDSPLSIADNNVEFIFDSIIVYNNSSPVIHGLDTQLYYPTSMFLISNAKSTIINGTESFPGTFTYNYGSVFKVFQSIVMLQGFLQFTGNTGIYGGAFLLLDSSVISLAQGSKVNFTGNQAKAYGGAIYSSTTRGNHFTKAACTFQVNEGEYEDVKVLFQSNTAMFFGNSVYSTSLYNCYMHNQLLGPGQLTSIYKAIFNTSLPKDILFTDAVTIGYCNRSSYGSYPGGTIQILLKAENALNDSTHAAVIVSAALSTYDGFRNIDWWFSEKNLLQISGNGSGCTIVNITIHTKDPKTVDIEGGHFGFLLFLIEGSNIFTRIDIQLHSCPPGFTHDISNTGSCICSDIIRNLTDSTPTCDINTKSISRPTKSSWMGLIELKNDTSFAVGLTCYSDYCDSNSSFNMITVNQEGSFKLSSSSVPGSTSSLCMGHRTGTLCGSCTDGYSIVFGSSECKQCTNWWLLTLLAYAAAGPLLIFMMYYLNLTLAFGTVYGIIFYAQVVNVGILDALNSSSHSLSRLLLIFLSFLNLGLGFPLCFYDGMTELWKAGLNLLFPLYLFMIIVLLIIVCRFSVKLSNKIASSSIQVSTTVVYLSFARLLSSIISAFKPAVIHLTKSTHNLTESARLMVWYWDGSIAYGSVGHVILMIVTSVIVFPLLVSYLFLLLFPKLLRCNQKLNEWTRPIIETIKAPYKEGRHYWFVARLLVIIFMYIVYSIEPYVSIINVTVILVLIFTVISQAIFNPYKSRLINLLDCWLLLNLTFLFTALYNSNGSSNAQNISFDLAVALFFITFLCIILYHCLMVSKRFRRAKEKLGQCFFKWYTNQRASEAINVVNNDDPYYSPCDEYREPLVKPTTTSLKFQ